MSHYDGFPKSLRIGPFDISIQTLGEDADDDDGSQTHGKWSFNRQLIKLRADQPSEVFAVDTALHEILHGIWCIYSIKREDDEERIVSIFATALAGVFRDNPSLVAWLGVRLNPDVQIRQASRAGRVSKARLERYRRSRRNPSRRIRRVI